MPLNPSKSPEDFLAQILDKLIGDEKAEGDEIHPSTAPWEVLPVQKPAIAGVNMGKAAIQDLAKAQLGKKLAFKLGVPVKASGEVFDVSNPEHMAILKPFMNKVHPHSTGADDFYSGEVVHGLLKERPNLLETSEVQDAIKLAGFDNLKKTIERSR